MMSGGVVEMPTPDSRAPEKRFSDRVENYVHFRPRYPDEVIAMLKSDAGLAPEAVIADVGSGTGISTEPFLRVGCTVFGVEPNREMREAAEKFLAGYPAFHSVNGTAGATTLEACTVDIVVAAQAFHWFNTAGTRAEFSRILKPDGQVVLMWNERKLDATPFLRDYEKLLLRFGTDYSAVRHENIGGAELRRFFIGGRFRNHTFANQQQFDFDGLKGRLLSSSYAPPAGEPGHEVMMAELRRLFDAHEVDGRVTFEYDTRVYLGR
jgi:SAM-dependent methyltransferase